MNDRFSYFGVTQYQDELCVENIGNCCLQCGDDLGHAFYLLISTSDIGMSRILEFGPIVDGQPFPDYTACSMHYSRIAYNERKIAKVIREFINRKGVFITYAQQIEMDDIRDKFFDISKEYFKMIGVE